MSLFKLSAYFVPFFFFLRQRESSNPESIQTDPLQIFLEAVENCKPVVGVISMERGGRVFQVRSVLRSRLCVVCALSCDLFSFYVHVYSQTDRRTDRTDGQTDRHRWARWHNSNVSYSISNSFSLFCIFSRYPLLSLRNDVDFWQSNG